MARLRWRASDRGGRTAASGFFPALAAISLAAGTGMSSAADGWITLFDTQLAMARSEELAQLFGHPRSGVQRRFEVCRAYFLGSSAESVGEFMEESHPLTTGSSSLYGRELWSGADCDPSRGCRSGGGGKGRSWRRASPFSSRLPKGRVGCPTNRT